MPAGTCLRAHVASQCTHLPRKSIRSGRLLDAPGTLGRLLDRPGVAGRNIAISQRRGGRFSPENTASVRMSPENESPEHGSHRSSPENENETPEPGIHEPNALKHSYDEQCVKWGESSSHENEYDSLVHGSAEACQMGNQRMEYRVGGHIGDRPRPSRELPPDHIGDQSESNRARSAPNRGPSPI